MIKKKHQPRGFEILFEDRDVIVGNKAAGALTVAAHWNKDQTVESAVTHFLRKGNPKNPHRAFVVHRLDQATTGVLMFAKNEKSQTILKDNWKSTVKTYLAVVHGQLKKKSGTISSYLEEDEEYVVHSKKTAGKGKLAETLYEVLAENDKYSLLKVGLVTGRKNQIRVHLADEGHPVVGDTKYGKKMGSGMEMALHSYKLDFAHPYHGRRIEVVAPVPPLFRKLIKYQFD